MDMVWILSGYGLDICGYGLEIYGYGLDIEWIWFGYLWILFGLVGRGVAGFGFVAGINIPLEAYHFN